MLRFTIKGPRALHLGVMDVIGFSWPRFGPLRERGNPYRNEVLRVVEVDHDATGAGRSAVAAIDLGGFLTTRTKFDKAVKFDATKRFGGDGRLLTVLG